MEKPGVLVHHCPKAGWPDAKAHEDEANHGTDAETRKYRNHESRGAENHQRVAETFGEERGGHVSIIAAAGSIFQWKVEKFRRSSISVPFL